MPVRPDELRARPDAGKRSIWFNGTQKGVEYPKERYEQYRARDFSIFRAVTGLVIAEPTPRGLDWHLPAGSCPTWIRTSRKLIGHAFDPARQLIATLSGLQLPMQSGNFRHD